MRSLKHTLIDWGNKEKLVIARVIRTWGSSPRPVGSALIIDEDLNMSGSVSGGCVEGAVLKEAKILFKEGGSKILSYGVSDEDAWSVGLSCGGKISVFIQRLEKDEFRDTLFSRICENEDCVWVTKIQNAAISHQFLFPFGEQDGKENIDDEILDEVKNAMKQRKSLSLEVSDDQYFIHNLSRKSLMLIIGSAHITADLVHLGKYYDFETVVIDPRATFAKRTSYPVDPDEIITAYPSEVLRNYPLDENTYAVILSHDPKIDDNALQILLHEEVAYIGALGSKRTHEKRVNRLKEGGFGEEKIARIAAPVGLKIKAKSPSEIALSIMGQIIEAKNKFL